MFAYAITEGNATLFNNDILITFATKLRNMKDLEKYRELAKEIDLKIESLNTLHKPHMQCKAGCAKCCLDFDVFPVEFYAIKAEMERDNFKIPVTKPTENFESLEDEEASCLFLKDNFCQIYKYRPIICRTHGLPLLSMNETADFWELSHCDLNFETMEPDFFHDENSLIMDKYNSVLFQANISFINANNLDIDVMELIPLRDLL